MPGGTKVQSIPGRDELPQTFETKVDLAARAEWNVLRPRLTIPQPVSLGSQVLYIEGIETGFVRGDRVLITGPRPAPGTTCGCGCGQPHPPPPGVDISILDVRAVTPEVEHGRTRLDLEVVPKVPPSSQPPARTVNDPPPNEPFSAPAAPPIPPVKPAEIDPPVFQLRSRPLTADEIRQRVLDFVWRDAWLAAQVALFALEPRHHHRLDQPPAPGPRPRSGPTTGSWSSRRGTPSAPRVVGGLPAQRRGRGPSQHPDQRHVQRADGPRRPTAAVELHEGSIGNADAGRSKWFDARAGTVRIASGRPPDQPDWLKSETTYYVVVKPTALDANGLTMGYRVRLLVQVEDYTGPEVTELDPPEPVPGAEDIDYPVNTVVTATFGSDVASVGDETFFLRDAGGNRVPASLKTRRGSGDA